MALALLFAFGTAVAGTIGNSSSEVIYESELRSAIAVQEGNQDDLFALPGVVAVGVGVAQDGITPALHVYFNEAIPQASITAVPTQLEGVPVRVFETETIRALDGPPGPHHRLSFKFPVPMGVSTGNPNGLFAGTLGARVHYRGQPNAVGYITNNHVAAASGPGLCPASVNPENLPQFGLRQCQPGRLDAGGACVREIGGLFKVVPIIMANTDAMDNVVPSNSFQNTVDTAFIASSRNLVKRSVLDITAGISPELDSQAIGLGVRKSGRTTGFTRSRIQSINVLVAVNYGGSPQNPCGTALFQGQIVIVSTTPGSPFSAAGDSGSLILGRRDSLGRRKAVGLLFAGSPSVTVANRIADVFGSLGVRIDVPR